MCRGNRSARSLLERVDREDTRGLGHRRAITVDDAIDVRAKALGVAIVGDVFLEHEQHLSVEEGK